MATSGETDLALVDTNIVLYAYDHQAEDKHRIARDLLQRLAAEDRLIFSAQVLNELAAVLLRRGRVTGGNGPEIQQIQEIVDEVAALGRVIPVSALLTHKALRAVEEHTLSFWDALLWAAAEVHAVGTLYSEDFQHGRTLAGVTFVNPFRQL